MYLLYKSESFVQYTVSQRPTYVEVGPLMTTKFGEVRCSTAVRQELMI